MYTFPTLRHNKLQRVDVPSPSKLYERLGFGHGTEKSSGDEFLDPSQSKVQMAQAVQKQVDAESKALDEAAAKVNE